MYGNLLSEGDQLKEELEAAEVDIEAEISKEVEGMKQPRLTGLFQPVKVDVQCGMLSPLPC